MSTSATISPATAALLQGHVDQVQREGRLPSIIAGVVRDGGLVWSGSGGTLDARPDGPAPEPEVQYRMGSITKTFVAVCVLQLRDAGRLALTDPVTAHLPDVADVPGLAHVTIEHLLTHSGGVAAETVGPWWERTPGGEFADLLASSVTGRFRPGRRFHYSNIGFALLGEVVARLQGRPLLDVVTTDLLTPLGMTRTTARPVAPAAPGLAVHPFADVVLAEPEHDAGAMAPAGQLWSTVPDLARWAAFAAGDTAGLLDPQTLTEMFEPHLVDDLRGLAWDTAHGLGWQVLNLGGVRTVGHGGSMPGFVAGLWVRQESGDGVVVLTNTTAPGPAYRGFGQRLLAAFEEADPAPKPAWHATGDPALLDLVGTWHWATMSSTLRVVDGLLVLGEPGVARGSRFTAVAEDTWIGMDAYFTGEPLRVVRDSDGTPVALDLASFTFTRNPYDPTAPIPGGVDPAGWR